MRRHPRLLAAVAAAAALLAPGTAAAAGGSAKAAGHAAYARQAALELASAVTRADRDAAVDALRASRRQAAAASRAAKALRRDGASRRAQARALRMTAVAYDFNLATYAAVLDRVEAPVAEAIARALAPTLNGREVALAALTELVPTLPAAAQRAAAAAIASIRGGVPADARALAAVDGLPGDIQALVDQAFGIAGAATAHAVEHLQELLPMLPVAARGPVEEALARVTQQLALVRELVSEIVGGIPAAGGSANPVGGILDAVARLLGGVLSQP